MHEKRVLVLGSTGMLGRAVVEALKRSQVRTVAASRHGGGITFDGLKDRVEDIIDSASLGSGSYIVNCIGITKSWIRESDYGSIESTIRLNSLLPLEIDEIAQRKGLRVLQVATDCVFSGLAGGYSEESTHDPIDIYGKTKSLGENPRRATMLLRTSLIGPESPQKSTLFFEWVRNLPLGANVKGYVNHNWNGLTSLTIAKIISGVILADFFTTNLQHLVPKDTITKRDLIHLQLAKFGRDDVEVEDFSTQQKVDRTLKTLYGEKNRTLFEMGGYSEIPSIDEMMDELLAWKETT